MSNININLINLYFSLFIFLFLFVFFNLCLFFFSLCLFLIDPHSVTYITLHIHTYIHTYIHIVPPLIFISLCSLYSYSFLPFFSPSLIILFLFYIYFLSPSLLQNSIQLLLYSQTFLVSAHILSFSLFSCALCLHFQSFSPFLLSLYISLIHFPFFFVAISISHLSFPVFYLSNLSFPFSK